MVVVGEFVLDLLGHQGVHVVGVEAHGGYLADGEAGVVDLLSFVLVEDGGGEGEVGGEGVEEDGESEEDFDQEEGFVLEEFVVFEEFGVVLLDALGVGGGGVGDEAVEGVIGVGEEGGLGGGVAEVLLGGSGGEGGDGFDVDEMGEAREGGDEGERDQGEVEDVDDAFEGDDADVLLGTDAFVARSQHLKILPPLFLFLSSLFPTPHLHHLPLIPLIHHIIILRHKQIEFLLIAPIVLPLLHHLPHLLRQQPQIHHRIELLLMLPQLLQQIPTIIYHIQPLVHHHNLRLLLQNQNTQENRGGLSW